MRYSERPNRGWIIRDMPEQDRPAERLRLKGAGVLSDVEMLTIIGGFDSLDVGRDVLTAGGGTLHGVACMGDDALLAIAGVGAAAVSRIRAAFALGARLRKGDDRPHISGPMSVVNYFDGMFVGKEQEELHVLLLDAKNRLMRDELVTVGLVDRTQVHAREVFRRAIQESCSRVVLVHNHPSGDPTPSAHDLACTDNLVEAGKIIGINVCDHVVIGVATDSRQHAYVSLRESNLIK